MKLMFQGESKFFSLLLLFKKNIKKFVIALQFLTIIPVSTKTNIEKSEIESIPVAFVPVGLIQAILLLIVYFISDDIFNKEITAAIILMVSILYNGGFHIDGLSDTFDAISVRGDKEKKLSIMKEGTAGPIGVTSIFFVLLFKYLLIKNLMFYPASIFYISIFLMPVFSKLSIIVSIFHAKPAKQEGMGNLFIGKLKIKELIFSFIIFFFLFLLLKIIFYHFLTVMDFFFFAFLTALLYVFCRISIFFFNRQFDGLTGDTLGAISEISELIFLFFSLIWYRFLFNSNNEVFAKYFI